MFAGEVIEAVDLTIRCRNIGVEIGTHTADRAAEHIAPGHPEHTRDATASGESGHIDTPPVDLVALPQIVIGVDRHPDAIEDVAFVS